MKCEYVVVQAGGKGTRLLPLTKNRPKSLTPVNNLPIMFHLFHKYPEKKFVIIGDYQFDVLERYLEIYASVNYVLVRASGSGNAAGLKEAISYIPDNQPLMIIWSDILLSDDFDIDALETGNYVGVTNHFECSWEYSNGCFEKRATKENGLAGCFLFADKDALMSLPAEGSFSRFLQSADIAFSILDMGSTEEVGTVASLNRVDHKENRCRPYNQITFEGEKVIKRGLTSEAEVLIQREIDWYKALDAAGFKGIPKIYSYDPLTLEKIHGDNIFKARLDDEAKKQVIDMLFLRLNEMHHLQPGEVNCFDMQEDYYLKTMKRLRSIRDVIPFSNQPTILINGVVCKNVYYYPEFLQEKVNKIIRDGEFGIIHGDCTLTNTLIDSDHNIYFIDARGYFGKTKLFGDVYYDWAKVYYSLQGAFDQFNVKNFELEIGEEQVEYQIGSSGWEHLTQYFLSKIPHCDYYRLKLIHAIIWLSLASHCWEDYDSLCTAFYNGLYLLNTFEKE